MAVNGLLRAAVRLRNYPFTHYTSTQTADVAKLLPLNKCEVTCPPMQCIAVLHLTITLPSTNPDVQITTKI